MKRKDERFFNWLNNTIFWKNFNLTKTDRDSKRVAMAVEHGVKQKGLTRSVPNRKSKRLRARLRMRGAK